MENSEMSNIKSELDKSIRSAALIVLEICPQLKNKELRKKLRDEEDSLLLKKLLIISISISVILTGVVYMMQLNISITKFSLIEAAAIFLVYYILTGKNRYIINNIDMVNEAEVRGILK